jgi:hypothetical protein
MWHGGFRVQDCAISPDGRRLVAADTEAKIHVYNFLTHEEEYCLPLPSKPTSVAISRDSRHVLVNLQEGEIQLVDMETTAVVRRFRGQKQGEYVIRSTFGGAAENFVISGSEGESFSCRLRDTTNSFPRLARLHLAQGERDTGRNIGRSCRGVRQLNILEPGRPRHVRVGGR